MSRSYFIDWSTDKNIQQDYIIYTNNSLISNETASIVVCKHHITCTKLPIQLVIDVSNGSPWDLCVVGLNFNSVQIKVT